MNSRFGFGFVLILLAASVAIGCGTSNMPDIGQVHGKVTLNGEPVEGAMVSFEPVEGGRTGWAMTDANGEYALKYSGNAKGTRTGENLVRITSAKSATRDDRGRVVEAAVKEKFPPQYNSESTQTVTVEGGSNEFNFAVTTDG
ncbi:carboxypeptidase-like regulatory domain-containing protein [Bremerella sp. T1]|uniref:carboxypeptidase-like regulatory domain-containing protein n=1 Tax=Bremerella sp. TYQ1 TaxID=3119568 RepID=UPI001CCA1599|nr:carboxypeptidase-like regulatory domain-containing protein [Bremerella volcania]UBM34301.1 carboxypeptidase-like regulatory domain-containing protein [Bremerella volcania]